MKAFREELKHFERQFSMSTADLADALGLPMETVKGWEVGVLEPCLDELRLLAEYSERSADYFLGLRSRAMVDVSHLEEAQVAMLQDLILVMNERNSREARKAKILELRSEGESDGGEVCSDINEKRLVWDLYRNYVGYRIRRARRNAGIEKGGLKGGNPCAYGTITMIERGSLNRAFNDSFVAKIAPFFQTTPEELLGAPSLAELKNAIIADPKPYLKEYVEQGKDYFNLLDSDLKKWYREMQWRELRSNVE